MVLNTPLKYLLVPINETVKKRKIHFFQIFYLKYLNFTLTIPLSLMNSIKIFDKTNYRHISILPVLSRAFERCLCDQIYQYIDTISKVHGGFRKGFSTRYSLDAMIEKWRKNIDKGKSCATLLSLI